MPDAPERISNVCGSSARPGALLRSAFDMPESGSRTAPDLPLKRKAAPLDANVGDTNETIAGYPPKSQRPRDTVPISKGVVRFLSSFPVQFLGSFDSAVGKKRLNKPEPSIPNADEL